MHCLRTLALAVAALTAFMAQSEAADANMMKQMLDAVNAERAKAGLKPYCYNSKLNTAAQKHSEDQARNKKMTHDGSDGADMAKRASREGYKWQGLGENVAAGQQTVADVMKSWMNSPGHKANIMGGSTHFGMGYAKGGNTPYWTQSFGSGKDEKCDSAPAPAPAPAPKPQPAPAPAPKPQPAPAPKPQPAPAPKPQPAPAPAPAPKPQPAPAPKPQPAPAPAPAPKPAGNNMQQEMLNAVNAERAKAGLKPYCYNKKLNAAAQKHSEDQAKHKKMTHDGSDGVNFADRAKREGYNWQGLAENVAAGQQTVADVMKSWMKSPGHKANIMGGSTHFGMGYAKGGNTPYWTQEFGSSSSEKCDAEVGGDADLDVQTEAPSLAPTQAPSVAPTKAPSVAPTQAPSVAPTDAPTDAPSPVPSASATPSTDASTPCPSGRGGRRRGGRHHRGGWQRNNGTTPEPAAEKSSYNVEELDN
ncbi:hypothetical protein Poli38472_008730 [Pythium oligandrum]|uniref:SCP domain-containing protein n=1 Tax=Pythium oligandrum TaxID=41045 RepID=A0A8K1C4Q2_PYTOL|nr:hypothetical protein Poli38472_008730 [Pythium oligandrum]|eukprot:TMW56082.1 hypothetical protein Poli38472_008730 [Pythium oligandrum]